jgi:hypothetical protein
VPYPKVRLRINPAEAVLLLPGLNTVACGLATAKLGAFPHRHPYDRVDLVASGIYVDRAYDDEMAGRFLDLRNKVRDIPQSRKIRFRRRRRIVRRSQATSEETREIPPSRQAHGDKEVWQGFVPGDRRALAQASGLGKI